MNNEIKEILEETRRLIDNSEYKIHYHYCIHYEVEYLDKLLNYITNLQQENERLKEENEYYKQRIYKINKYLQQRSIEFKNAGKSRKNIKAHHYYMLIQDIIKILQKGDN